MRLKIILTLIFLFYMLIIGKVYDLTINKHSYYKKLAIQNITKKIYIAPIRGSIYDSNHIPIAYNELRFSILFKPHLKDNKLKQTINFLHKYIDFNRNKIFRKYKKSNSIYNHKFIPILEYIKYKDILDIFSIISQNENIKIESDYLRIYPFKDIMSHIIGYVGRSTNKTNNLIDKYIKLTGKNGIEKSYNKELAGTLGYRNVIVNAKNQIIKEINSSKPTSENLELNIDTRLQKFIFEIFKEENKKGSIVVMKTSGEIVSMVNFPSYDDNLFVKGISTKEWQKLIHNHFNPFLNKAIAGLYPAGSIIKPSIGLIALASKKIKPYEKIFCPGYIEIGKRKFRDWKPGGHGYVDIFMSIQRSVDVYYYKIGLLLGINYIAKNLRKMGFGKKTGIDLPNERKGIIPDKFWKRKKYNQTWFIGETLNASIGQGYVLVTPIQTAVNTALLATAKLPIPKIVKKIGNKTLKPTLKDVLTKEEKKSLPLIRKGMWKVCNTRNGTATKHLQIPYFRIAGKTGTAQVHSIPQDIKKRKRENELAYWKRSHAWFTTYGPYKNPKFIVTVMIEHGGHGGSAAGGIVSKIYNKLVALGYIKAKINHNLVKSKLK